MTKQLKTILNNIQLNLANLAARTSNRDSVNEKKISDVNTELSSEITNLEEQLSLADETAIELYEYQLEQADINNAQDEALIELFEALYV